MPTATEIAEAVWNFDQNDVKMRDRMQGTDAAANATKQELFRLSQWNDDTHASPLGNLVVEQLHGDARGIIARIAKQQRRHRTVHPAAHRNQHTLLLFAIHLGLLLQTTYHREAHDPERPSSNHQARYSQRT